VTDNDGWLIGQEAGIRTPCTGSRGEIRELADPKGVAPLVAVRKHFLADNGLIEILFAWMFNKVWSRIAQEFTRKLENRRM